MIRLIVSTQRSVGGKLCQHVAFSGGHVVVDFFLAAAAAAVATRKDGDRNLI